MHDIKHAQPALPAGDLRPPAGPRPGFARGNGLDPDSLHVPPQGETKPRGRRARHGQWAGEGAMPAIERKRRAAVQLRKAFGRIKADFSEAYEHCRNEAQRRALELAHRSAKAAHLRALQEHLLDDRDGWAQALAGFRRDKEKADRSLARLVTADAVIRILNRLAAVEAQLAVLAG